jgi:hypothetical protein|nr:hypothetical protein Q903MT_gene1147 [Picea sitchensis]
MPIPGQDAYAYPGKMDDWVYPGWSMPIPGRWMTGSIPAGQCLSRMNPSYLTEADRRPSADRLIDRESYEEEWLTQQRRVRYAAYSKTGPGT